MRKPALTEKLLSAIARCLVDAEAMAAADDTTPKADWDAVERVDKFLSDMRAWKALREV